MAAECIAMFDKYDDVTYRYFEQVAYYYYCHKMYGQADEIRKYLAQHMPSRKLYEQSCYRVYLYCLERNHPWTIYLDEKIQYHRKKPSKCEGEVYSQDAIDKYNRWNKLPYNPKNCKGAHSMSWDRFAVVPPNNKFDTGNISINSRGYYSYPDIIGSEVHPVTTKDSRNNKIYYNKRSKKQSRRRNIIWKGGKKIYNRYNEDYL